MLHVGDKVYRGESPAVAFTHFCEEMAITYPLKIRSLVGVRIRGRADIPLKRTNNGDDSWAKLANVNAYVDGKMLINHAGLYTLGVWHVRDKDAEYIDER